MLKHHLLLIFRNFKRHKSSFFINLIGLTTGLTCVILIYLWINDELSVDRFFKNDDRLFQVMQNFKDPSGISTLEWTPGPLAQALAEETDEVEYAASVFPPSNYAFNAILSNEETHLKVRAKFASTDYFNVFSYNLIRGDKDQVLEDRNSVVISDQLAIKLFNTTDDVVGKSITCEQGELAGSYLISGVFEKIPSNASIQFDVIFKYELYRDKHRDLERWDYNDPCTYVILRDQVNPGLFSQKIAGFVKKNYSDSKGTLFLRKYSDQYLYGNYENGKVSGGRITYVRIFSIIALFMLILACINFMNLSTARSSGRSKEVGIKKSIGAKRSGLIAQYLGESLFITTLSLFMAILLVTILLPLFNQVTGKELTFDLNITLILSLLGITIFTGIVAGSYPAIYLSGFNPVLILKGKVITSTASLWARQALVVFQFMLSIFLILSVLVLYKQMEYVQSKNLGYEKDNVISFSSNDLKDDDLGTLLSEIKNIPGVVNASAMRGNMTSGDHNSTSALSWEGQLPGEEIDFTDLCVHYGFFKTLGIEVAEGRVFSREYNSENSKIILNQTAIKKMGLVNPVGKFITLWGGKRQIIGVVNDFHFESLYHRVTPAFFRLVSEASNSDVLVKIKAGMEKKTLAKLQNLYRQRYLGSPLDFKFLDQEYQALYIAEQRIAILSRYFAGLAILISCLGLFGLAAFTAERRTKEIGIRKALGSDEFGIVRLLSGEFSKMVLIAAVIILPIGYLIVQEWLNNFAYRIDLRWWYFIVPGLSALIVAWLTVGMQTVKAAMINPVECLKEE